MSKILCVLNSIERGLKMLKKRVIIFLLVLMVLSTFYGYLYSDYNKCDVAYARCLLEIEDNFTLFLQLAYCEWGWAFCMKYLPK